MEKNQQLIVILVAVLLAVVVASAALIFFLPSAAPSDSEPTTSATPTRATSEVLQRPEWRALNQQVVQQGLVPAQAPAVVGKANPFL